jgi:glycine/D-amino acid oxidase-like deaminating enzyme
VGTRPEVDIAIVGGGIVGMSLAYGLAGEGRRIIVLDEDDLSLRASRGNFALVWLQSKGFGMPDYARWTRRSVDLWSRFAGELEAETGIKVAYEQRGGFLLYLDEAGLDARTRALARLRDELGADCFPFEVMGHEALARMLPAIGAGVVGGIYCPLDGHVNVLRFFSALHEACRRRGVRYRPREAITAIKAGGGAFTLATASGHLETQCLVLAAGLGNARLAPMVGLTAPVHPQRGQVIVTEKLDRFLDYPLATLRQTDEGGVMIGASKEDAGFDVGTTAKVLSGLAEEAVRMFPLLARARVVRTWSALRVMTPDGFPIYEASSEAPGAFLVTCHSGVTLAAAHALDLAPSLNLGALSQRFGCFASRRFRNVPQAI